MKMGRRRPHLALLLLVSALAGEATSSTPPQSEVNSVQYRDVPESSVSSRANPVGTEHAPVDGKDGMPHEGPWIQTETDRKKQKSQESDDGETVIVYSSKPSTTDMPQSNEGVMDDRNRNSPTDGTRGTEGGVSERSKDGQALDQKKPEAPKEVPDLPHSEKEKIKEAEDVNEDTPDADTDASDTKKPYAVPTDFPPTPYSNPLSDSPSSPFDNTITPDQPTFTSPTDPHSPSVISPIHSLVLSFTMILFSEIGDKTFLVACLMAMRHDRILVFTAAFSALITMTVLSAVLGHAVPSLISPHITNFLAAALFLVFGVRMLIEARKIDPNEGVSEEMKEVEMELEEKEQLAARRARRRSSISPYVLESGRAPRHHKAPGRSLPSPPSSTGSRSPSPSRASSLHNALDGLTNLFSLLLSPAWVQTFIMTFLGEWGDRSQIATIAMAAGQDYWWVTAGALGGHAICTGVAVIGGKAIAGRVSLRTVTMGGAIAFLVFGVVYLAEAMW